MTRARFTQVAQVTLPWWRHQMETFSALLTLCEGNPPVTGGFPSQRTVTRSDAEWCFLWSAPQQTVEQAIEIWDATALVITSLEFDFVPCQMSSRSDIVTAFFMATWFLRFQLGCWYVCSVDYKICWVNISLKSGPCDLLYVHSLAQVTNKAFTDAGNRAY